MKISFRQLAVSLLLLCVFAALTFVVNAQERGINVGAPKRDAAISDSSGARVRLAPG